MKTVTMKKKTDNVQTGRVGPVRSAVRAPRTVRLAHRLAGRNKTRQRQASRALAE